MGGFLIVKTFTLNSPEQTIKLGEEIGKRLKQGDVVAYTGGMGMGKTTFTHGLAAGLGIKADVSSPTFALINEYRGEKFSLYHFDMYRITTQEDLYSTGFFDYLGGEDVLAIEWSENISAVLPENTIYIHINANCENSRTITVEGDERFEDIIA